MKRALIKHIKTSMLIFVCLHVFVSIQAQSTKEIKDLFKEAEEHLLYESYELALPVFQELVEKGLDNANVNFSIGICYLNSRGQTLQAIPYLEKAVTNIASNYKEGNYKEDRAPEEAWFYLGKAYRILGYFDKAKDAYRQYKSFLPASDLYYQSFLDLQLKNCDIAREMIKKPINFNKTDMPINKEMDNYSPAISGDERTLLFTAMQKESDEYGEFFLQVIYSSVFDGYSWSDPKDISADIGSDGYFKSCFLNTDGTYMLLFRDDYGNGNIYYSEKKGGKWTEAELLPRYISGKSNEGYASLSRDGNILYFSSDREGGLGGSDIYMSVKDSKGRWGKPTNLGEDINTMFEEQTPVISQDGKTLYFASEAHTSMGGYDIFKTVKGSDGSWSTPQNLGYPINTAADELSYMPFENGAEAFMPKYPDGGGYKRIYHIDYPSVQRVITVASNESGNSNDISQEDNSSTTGGIDNSTSNQTGGGQKTIVLPSEYELNGTLSLEDNKDLNSSFYIHVAKPDGEVIAALSPNVSTGEFRSKVKYGSYIVKAFGEGYEPAQKTIFIGENEQNPEVVTFLKMVPIEVSKGEYYSIKSILFDENSHWLNQDAKIEIEKLARVMENNPSLRVEVVGNTDSKGTECYNQVLSVDRAKSVVNYISNKGISRSRFVAKGLGENNLIAINQNPDGSDNAEGRRLNRRVEIKLLNPTKDNVVVESVFVPNELKYKENLLYTILLESSERPLSPSKFNLRGGAINNVWMYETGGEYIYTVGKFINKADAIGLMNVVVDAGFPNARVISSVEYNELSQESSKFFQTKMNSKDRTVYTIQLAAFKELAKNSRLSRIPGIKVTVGKDGYYRYTIGEFIGKISARQALKSIINRGFSNAFIVEVSKL